MSSESCSLAVEEAKQLEEETFTPELTLLVNERLVKESDLKIQKKQTVIKGRVSVSF